MNTAITGLFKVFVEHGLRAVRCSEQRAAARSILLISSLFDSHDEMNNNYGASRSVDLFRTDNLPRPKKNIILKEIFKKKWSRFCKDISTHSTSKRRINISDDI